MGGGDLFGTLSMFGLLPRHYGPFLEHSVELLFLRRVDKGYIFTHRLLMEYFASLPQSD